MFPRGSVLIRQLGIPQHRPETTFFRLLLRGAESFSLIVLTSPRGVPETSQR